MAFYSKNFSIEELCNLNFYATACQANFSNNSSNSYSKIINKNFYVYTSVCNEESMNISIFISAKTSEFTSSVIDCIVLENDEFDIKIFILFKDNPIHLKPTIYDADEVFTAIDFNLSKCDMFMVKRVEYNDKNQINIINIYGDGFLRKERQ